MTPNYPATQAAGMPLAGRARQPRIAVPGIIGRILEKADIRIGGHRPWDPQVHDARLFARIAAQGSLGLGEAYMEGWWDCDALDDFFARILKAREGFRTGSGLGPFMTALRSKLQGIGYRRGARDGGKTHYEIGNDLYRRMLDRRMIYTCGFWDSAADLDEAQEAKLDLTCRKIGLQPGMRVLDIGCGWGGFAKFAAERYGVEVVGITLSENQMALGRENCRGLPVEIRLQDYREVRGAFDRIVSLGMFEHVGLRNLRRYMEAAQRCLKDGGLFLLHTIGENVSQKDFDPWMDRYIFPGAFLPSLLQIGSALEGLFVMEDWHNQSTDYDRTLCAWHGNFERHWPELAPAYGETFRRMWRYYLLQCAGGFRVRKNQLWQIVLSRNPKAKYRSIR